MASTDLERALVSALMHWPEHIERARELIEPLDFQQACTRTVFIHLEAMASAGVEFTLPDFVERLRHAEVLESECGGVVGVASLFDEEEFSKWDERHLSGMKRQSIQLHLMRLYAEVAGGPVPTEQWEARRLRIAFLEEELASFSRKELRLEDVGFTGERLMELRERPVPDSPLPELLDPYPTLTILAGRSKMGKTTLAAYLAQCWSAGVSPWLGAPVLPGSRALILSGEQPVIRIDTTMRRMDILHHELDRAVWTDRCILIARDHTLRREARPLFCLDDDGIATLRTLLLWAKQQGDPIGFLVLDSLSRLLPSDLDENSNPDMTIFCDALQCLAEELDCHILMIHHTNKDEAAQGHSAIRGAGAIVNVAQAAWLFDQIPGELRFRKILARGNAIPEKTHTFRVALENDEEGHVTCFRPEAALAIYPIGELINPGETINTSELALRLGTRAGRAEPNGHDRSLATELRTFWERTGKVEVRKEGRSIVLSYLSRASSDDSSMG